MEKGNIAPEGDQIRVQIWSLSARAMDLRSGPINKTFARACDRTSYYLNTCFWDLKMGQFWGQNRGPK